MDTRSILFLVVMAAIGVVGLLAFLIFLWARQGLPGMAPAAQRGRGGAPARPGAALVGPAVLAAAGVAGGLALLIWLLLANAEVFRLDIAWDPGTITFLVIMLVIAAAGLLGFVIYLAVLAARHRAGRGAAPTTEGAAASPAEGAAAEAVQTPAPTRMLGLLVLLLAFLILNWSFVDLGTRYLMMSWLMYPASLAFALVLLFDKATRTWSYKSKIASFREWLFADLTVFLFVLAYLNLVWSNAKDDYNGLLWDVIGVLLFVFVFWLLDRKVTRLRFLVVYGYLILLPIGLLIWTSAHDMPARLGFEQNERITAAVVATAAEEAAQGAAEEAVDSINDGEEDDGGFGGDEEDDGGFGGDEEDDGGFFTDEDDAPDFALEEDEALEVEALSWWSSIWPFFFLAIIFFVLEIIVLLAIEETESSAIALLKDLLFIVLYVILLIAAIPGTD